MKCQYIVISLLVLQLHSRSFTQGDLLSYTDARNAILNAEDLLTTGGRLKLSSRELEADQLFMQHKSDVLSRGLETPEINAAGLHFFKAKELISRSKIFKFLQQMPKGAVLHLHNSAGVSSEWVVRNISYMPNLLRCTNKNGISIFSFRRLPGRHGCQSRYVRVGDERRRSIDFGAYDRSFEKLINLYTPAPEVEYNSINRVWTKFEDMFTAMDDMLRYIPAYRSFHWRLLEELYEDNIMYGEIRMSFKELYDYSGRVYNADHAVQELLNVIEQFRQQHSNFLGVRVIFSAHRSTDSGSLRNTLQSFKSLHERYPQFVIGFDLVGQEDKGKPLLNFIDVLVELPPTARFFFHAGETNWYGASTDMNLVDAILLNTSRIGHGYALLKHPVLLNAVKARDIAVEVSPISNQVLHLVEDLRNHPASYFISNNVPIVICNDDPGFWNAKALSYDYFYAIMSLAPSNAGLKTLKNLVWNTITYSSLESEQRQLAFKNLQKAWDHFIDDVLLGLVL